MRPWTLVLAPGHPQAVASTMIIPDQPNIFKATKDLSFGFNDIMIMNLPVPGTKKKKKNTAHD